MTSASKVEQVLLPPSPAGEHLCPSRSAEPALRGTPVQAPLRSAPTGPDFPSGCCREWAPGEGAGERRGPALWRKRASALPTRRRRGQNFPNATRAQGGPGPAPGAPAPGPHFSRAAPRFLHPAAPDAVSLGSASLLRLFSSAPRETLAPARRPGAPHSPHRERSPSARRARERGRRLAVRARSSSQRPLLSRPPTGLERGGGRRVSPARYPTQTRDARSAAPCPPPPGARRRPEGGAGAALGGAAGRGGGRPGLASAARPDCTGAHWPLWVSGAGRGTDDLSFREQMPSLGGHLQADLAEWKLSSRVTLWE